MTNYKITLGSTSPKIVKLTNQNIFTTSVTVGGIVVPSKFEDLIDFDNTELNDKYVIMYDSSTQKYKLVNPDEVLSASSTTEVIQPGLPNDFVDTLDVDLDDRIDLDAGSF